MSALKENEFSISKFSWIVSFEMQKTKLWITYDFGINEIHSEFVKFIVKGIS